jgi:hypothetical protein
MKAAPPTTQHAESRYTTLATRFGLLATAVVGWSTASRFLDVGNIPANSLSLGLMLGTWVVCFALLGLAIPSRPPRWAPWAIAAACALLFADFLQMEEVQAGMRGIHAATDVYVFQDYAARLLLGGSNPYAHDLRPGFGVHHLWLMHSTPLLNGDFTGQLAYPALSPLLFALFQVLGLPTWLLYPLLLVATLVVLFLAAPEEWRPLILLPWFAEPRFLTYAFNGVNDYGWSLLLVLVVATWHKPRQRGIWYGLACAYKQQPWLLAPFLLIRLWREADGAPRQRLRDLARFGGWAAVPFILLNLPFVIMDPSAWLTGVTEPLSADMITLGSGLSALTTTGVVVLPKALHSILLWGGLGILAWVYWRHFPRLVELMWIAPGMAMWLGNRSLTAYWYFWALPLALALARAWRHPPTNEQPVADHRPTALVLASFLAFILASLWWYGRTEPPFRVEVLPRVDGSGEWVNRLAITVENTDDEVLVPRFSVQSKSKQPLQWVATRVPEALQPGEHQTYVLHTDVLWKRFHVRHGARVTVQDAHSYDRRSTVFLPPVRGFQHQGHIVNGSFQYWMPNGPWGWSLTGPRRAGRVEPLSPSFGPGRVAISLHSSRDREYRSVGLETSLSLPTSPIAVEVKVPAAANQLPNLDLLYGVELVVHRRTVLLLPGDAASSGTLDDGRPYQIIPAPRETWTEIEVDPAQVFATLNLPAAPDRAHSRGITDNDDSMTPMILRVMTAVRGWGRGAETQFGSVRSVVTGDEIQRHFERTRRHPEEWELWIANYNAELGNLEVAKAHLERAIDLAPNDPRAYFRLGEALVALRAPEAALEAFAGAASHGHDTADIARGRGWALLQLGRFQEASEAFEAALVGYRDANRLGTWYEDVQRGARAAAEGLAECDPGADPCEPDRDDAVRSE